MKKVMLEQTMKPKLLLGLVLVLSGYCRAAIVYPKAPDGGREIVVTNVAPILGHDTSFFNGLKMEDLTVAEPYRGIMSRIWRCLLQGTCFPRPHRVRGVIS